MDWLAIERLLNVANLSLQWPTLKPLHDAAMAELVKRQSPPKPTVGPVAAAIESVAQPVAEVVDEILPKGTSVPSRRQLGDS